MQAKELKPITAFFGIVFSAGLFAVVTMLCLRSQDDFAIWQLSGLEGWLQTLVRAVIWLLLVPLSVVVCYRCCRVGASAPLICFYLWLAGAGVFAVVVFIGGGWGMIAIAIFHTIPVFIGAMLLEGAVLRWFLKKKEIPLLASSFTMLWVVAVGAFIEFDAMHWASYENGRYEIEVFCYSEISFREWPISGEIEIEDKVLGLSGEFDFWFSEGPYFDVCVESGPGGIVYLRGTGHNRGFGWAIDLNTGTVEQAHRGGEAAPSTIIVSLGSDFRFILPSPKPAIAP